MLPKNYTTIHSHASYRIDLSILSSYGRKRTLSSI